MKKAFFCVLVLFLFFTAAVFADRGAIEGVITAYEAVVTEAENVAGMPLIAPDNLSALQQNAEAVAPRVAAIENEREWAIQDAVRLAALNVRFNQAMTAITKKLVQY
uniref:Uncharacterized protein n=1 Tax=uncultured bacterium contig00014 TaxID=1181505 RepID=A0A806K0U4_9BACT|nr:hypothetical protein [uncultured bacterium contig00014]